MDTVKSLVRAARTYRSFKPVPVDREVLLGLADTARLTGCATNRQVLKYRLVTEEAEVLGMLGQARFGSLLTDVHLPPEGRHPRAYLVICHDTAVAPRAPYHNVDVGIAAEAIVLGAAEQGLGCCMLGSFKPDALRSFLGLPDSLEPVLAVAVGVPDEEVRLAELPASGDTSYYRVGGVHYAPKRPLDDVII